MTGRVVLATCVVGLILALGAMPAGAGEFTERDRLRDVDGFRYDPDPPPCGTITEVQPPDRRIGDVKKLVVHHSRSQIDVVLQLRRMPRPSRSWAAFYVRTPNRAYEIDFYRSGGTDQAMISVEKPPPPVPPGKECHGWAETVNVRNCPALVAEQDRTGARVSVSFPRRCLSTPKWIRVGADAGFAQGGAFFDDTWAPRGSKPSGPWQHVYTPRVRPSR